MYWLCVVQSGDDVVVRRQSPLPGLTTPVDRFRDATRWLSLSLLTGDPLRVAVSPPHPLRVAASRCLPAPRNRALNARV